MRYHRQLRKIMLIVTIMSLLLVVALSYFQATFPEVIAIVIFNNAMICILTGSLISLFQAVVGYINEKRDAILLFYKDAIMFKDKNINYPFMRSEFIDSISGLKDVREVINLFQYKCKLSYLRIEINPQSEDIVMTAAKRIYISYCAQIRVFREMRSSLYDGIRFMYKSEDDLISDGVDNQSETESMNRLLQQKEEEIEKAYNDEAAGRERNSIFQLLRYICFTEGLV